MKEKAEKTFSARDMLRTIALLICLIILGTAVVGCGGQAAKAAALVSPAKVKPSDKYDEFSDAFRKALWEFAYKTSGAAMPVKGDKNLLYSPISLYYGLAMLEAGSAGKTKADLRKFLEMTEGTDSGKELKKLYSLMLHEGKSEEQIANAIWMREDIAGKVGQAWLDQLANNFYASAFKVDFGKDNTASMVSKWVEEQTKGKIKPKIDVDKRVLMILMNTLYFKAEWADKFSEDANTKKIFFAPSGQVSDVTFLNAVLTNQTYLRTDDFLATQIFLKNGKVDFILPSEGKTPESILANPEILRSIQEGVRKPAKVEFSVPKFTYRDKIDILDGMEMLGLKSMLQEAPDFSVMLPDPTIEAYVSKISQEAFIDLNEKGVEAAAYTEITMREVSMPDDPETIVMNLDRPFIYVISDDTGVPLFVGVVQNPTAEK